MTSPERVLHIGGNRKLNNTDIFFSLTEIKKLEDKPPVGNTEAIKRKQFKSRQKSWKQLFHRSPSTNSVNKLDISPRQKLTALVSKHFSSLKLFSSTPNTCISTATSSCPDLSAKLKDRSQIKKQEDIFKSDSRLDLVTSPGPKRGKSQRNHLGVPDIFTTSLNSNSPSADNLLSHWTPKNLCKSAQSLHSPSTSDRIKLTRSLSDTPPRKCDRRLNSTTSLNISSCLRSRMFKHEHVSQILDHLFIGNIEASFNEPLLCKLGIESLIDMSNVSNMQVPAKKKTLCPCLCPGETPHFRSRLIICIADNDKEDIEQYFHEIDRFIDAARKCDKKVLIFSYFGKSRAPAAAIQYLMTHESFLLRQAFNLVKNQRPDISINPGFQKSLETLERRLFPDAKPSVSIYNEYLNVADPQAIKCAWVDC